MLKTTGSKEAQTIQIENSVSSVVLDNILFGEVWLCSGQSNMEEALKGYTDQPVFGALHAIATSRNSNIRLFTVKRGASKSPLNDLQDYRAWAEAGPDDVLQFSAVAYFFGRQLQEILDVPVGLILSAWSGSSIQPWISDEVMTGFQTVDLDTVDIANKTNNIPTVLYNAMINPVIPFGIKGVLWYQGEANRKEPQLYQQLLPAMVTDWRRRWGIGDFPFYFVQIAPYCYDNSYAFQSADNSAFMREAQLQCAEKIPNSAIAITMDIGDENCIHPPRKKEVADRLLYLALNKTYGFKAVDCDSPVFDSLEKKDGGLLVNFKYAETGLYAVGDLNGFEIAGDDRVFYPANAKILVKHKQVFVVSDKVPNPVAVRYAWRNWTVGNLYDTNMLPVSSFRTDSWDNATQFCKDN